MTCLCSLCRQIIQSMPVPVGCPIPPDIAEDRRESFRAWAGLCVAVGQHMGTCHQEWVAEAMDRTLSFVLMSSVVSSDQEFRAWFGALQTQAGVKITVEDAKWVKKEQASEN